MQAFIVIPSDSHQLLFTQLVGERLQNAANRIIFQSAIDIFSNEPARYQFHAASKRWVHFFCLGRLENQSLPTQFVVVILTSVKAHEPDSCILDEIVLALSEPLNPLLL